MSFHEKIMNKCLSLAEKGQGFVFPNPMVGAIIVYKKKIIGKGYHENFGGEHAEVNAINSVKNKNLLKNSTLYVNLEPCFHVGKTPPCVDFILNNKIKNIVIGIQDPNKNTAGKSIKKLKKNCNVLVGICKKSCKNINHKFFVNQIHNRPFIILKWAQTKDGFINTINYKKGAQTISCKESQKLSHKWRSEEDAIMIGKTTALYDNPKLTTRNVKGKNPIRVVIDKDFTLPKTLNIFNSESKTIVLTKQNKHAQKILKTHNLLFVDFNKKDALFEIMRVLKKQNINSIIIEGGSILLNSFLKENLWDEVRIFISPKKNKNGIPCPDYSGPLERKDYYSIIGGIDKLYNNKNLKII